MCPSSINYALILTAPDDYDRESVPNNVILNSFRSTECLQIPTFINEEQATSSESFRINVTELAVIPPFLGILAFIESGNSMVLVTLFEQCVDGDVRLVGALQGRVQMCYNGVFGFVCDTDGWTMQEAEVVCSQLGNVAIPSKLYDHYSHGLQMSRSKRRQI